MNVKKSPTNVTISVDELSKRVQAVVLSTEKDDELDFLIQQLFSTASYYVLDNAAALVSVLATEKQSRISKKQAFTSRILSLVAKGFSVVALSASAYFSYTASKNSKKWQETQTRILKEIKGIMAASEDKEQAQIEILEDIRDRIPSVEE